jgi:hypothetical protein
MGINQKGQLKSSVLGLLTTTDTIWEANKQWSSNSKISLISSQTENGKRGPVREAWRTEDCPSASANLPLCHAGAKVIDAFFFTLHLLSGLYLGQIQRNIRIQRPLVDADPEVGRPWGHSSWKGRKVDLKVQMSCKVKNHSREFINVFHSVIFPCCKRIPKVGVTDFHLLLSQR